MFVVVIREVTGTLNIIGPFWHRNAAEVFRASLAAETESTIESVTDREKFTHDNDS